ncbi:hypothetical protein SO802_029329 [Lithocarpus litseifolius]|uniref:RNase H type-1 domain-containing protein n=1 Tax=Lithocarpus litseifolius TaxID=425828 RepID=A0AAW2BSU7_9ROSI
MKDSNLLINPKPPWYKINTDGAIFAQQQAIGVGVVVRDHKGRVMAVLSNLLHFPLGPLEAKAKSLEEAVEFAWDVGIRDAHFECNSLLLSDAVQGASIPPVAISNIVSGIYHKLQAFKSVLMSHVRQEGKKPADILAQYAKGIVSYIIWVEKDPNIIESALTHHDILNLSSS